MEFSPGASESSSTPSVDICDQERLLSRQRRRLTLSLSNADGMGTDECSAMEDPEAEVGGFLGASMASRVGRTLGAMQGVFAPVALSQFSSLLFLRIGYIVGNAGLVESLIQLSLGYVILLTTVASISAIVSNGAVEAGGVYYMISRTLGPEFGGSIGALFYFANVVGSALYATGCAEGIINNFGPMGLVSHSLPGGRWVQMGYASVLNLINLVICVVGAKMFGRTSAFVLLGVCACTLVVGASFFDDYYVEKIFNETDVNCTATAAVNCTYKLYNGTFTGLANTTWSHLTGLAADNAWAQYSLDCEDHDANASFATVFAVLFSGITGIMAGANLSGELEKPAKAIPKGTFSACTFTYLTYAFLFILTALTCNRTLLFHDCQYMTEFAFWKPIVAIGTILCTFTASTSCLIGSSRVLYAVAKDEMFGRMLSSVERATWHGNPLLAVVITWALVQMFFLIGSLNQIARMCSVLFLLSYAGVNFACFTLDWASAPNFRPTFNCFTWHTCLAGVGFSIAMMFVCSPMYAGICMALCLLIILGIHFFSPATNRNWGSVSQAILFHQVRKYLLFLDPRKEHVKFWRPQVLLLVRNPRSACAIIDFANTLKKGGLYVLGHVDVRAGHDVVAADADDPSITQMPDWLGLVDHLKVKAFTEITVSSSLRSGAQHLARLSGLGAMKPNTVILGFPQVGNDRMARNDFGPDSRYASDAMSAAFPTTDAAVPIVSNEEFVTVINDLLALRKNVCVHRNFDRLEVPGSNTKRFLDVWLVDFFSLSGDVMTDVSGLFMLQLACIVNMVRRWRGLRVRVLVRADGHVGEDLLKARLTELLAEARITAQICTVDMEYPVEVMQHHSSLEGVNRLPLSSISDAYVEHMNSRVLSESTTTAVSFLYLVRPPTDSTLADRYVRLLDALTAGMAPPLLLVHGVSPVITTAI